MQISFLRVCVCAQHRLGYVPKSNPGLTSVLSQISARQVEKACAIAPSLFFKRSICSWLHHLRATSAAAQKNGQLWIRAEPALAAKVAEGLREGYAKRSFRECVRLGANTALFCEQMCAEQNDTCGIRTHAGRPHRLSRPTP